MGFAEFEPKAIDGWKKKQTGDIFTLWYVIYRRWCLTDDGTTKC